MPRHMLRPRKRRLANRTFVISSHSCLFLLSYPYVLSVLSGLLLQAFVVLILGIEDECVIVDEGTGGGVVRVASV